MILIGTLALLIPKPLRATITEEARRYLTDALDLIEEHALNSAQVSWESWRQIALRRAEHAQTPEDTYPLIQETLAKLRDNHSSFVPAASETASGSPTSWQVPFVAPTGVMATEDIAILAIPACCGAYDSDSIDRYAATLHELIRSLSGSSAAGWIVDLRSNSGGNMWPMVNGLGPILGEGVCGYFVFPSDAREEAWGYRGGASFLGEDEVVKVTPPVLCPTIEPLPPVAVLIGPRTASSGEAVAVAFIGRPNTRSFGRPSSGLTTGNRGFELSDGARIVLTVCLFADRTGKSYGRKLVPNVEIYPPPWSSGGDPVAEAAIAWLESQISTTTEP